ncbi:MAG TPA: hypothetical protein VGL75_10580 [Acidothermaceae bacterium]|jgi:hypothetical protein
MTDVEQLLRETLADPRHRLDPGPGMYDTVRQRARQRRRRVVQVASAFTAVVVIAGVGTAIGVNSGHGRGDQVAAPSITPSRSTTSSPQTGQATSVDLGKGSTRAMAVTSSMVFVARQAPNELLRVSTADQSVTKRTATPDAVDGTAVDAVAGQVWTWSTTEATVDDSGKSASVGVANSGDSAGADSTRIHAYATSTLAIDGALTIPTYTFDATALDGQLWLATNDGLYVVTTAASGPVATKVITGMVFSVAVDAVRHRVLYGSAISGPGGENSLGSVVVHEIDAYTRAVIAVSTPLPIGKESIAIVGDQIWVGGYGSGSTPRLFHLDGSSLQSLPTEMSGADDSLGPGAIVWPGASVVWVRSGGSEGLACIDPQSGALLEQWPAVQGPVASVRGQAFAVSDGSLDQLSLTGGCTG